MFIYRALTLESEMCTVNTKTTERGNVNDKSVTVLLHNALRLLSIGIDIKYIRSVERIAYFFVLRRTDSAIVYF